jgi:hypothetical protein
MGGNTKKAKLLIFARSLKRGCPPKAKAKGAGCCSLLD